MAAGRIGGDRRRRQESATLSAAWTEPGPPLPPAPGFASPIRLGPLASVARRRRRAPVGDYMVAPGAPEPWIGLSVSANGRRGRPIAVVEHADFLRGVTRLRPPWLWSKQEDVEAQSHCER